MYDMAKRSMAFAVATGGLLLSGPACAVAAAAEDPGAAAGSVSAHAEVANQLATQAVAAQLAAPSAAVGSANSVDAPINLGLNLCGTSVSLLSSSSSANCSTTSGGAAGAAAAAATPAAQQSAVLSGNSVRTPITLSLNACGNGVSVASAAASALGSACTVDHASGQRSGIGLGGSAGGGSVLSDNSVKLPISVPLNACGNSVELLADAATDMISCAIAEGVTASSSGQAASGSAASGSAGSQSGTASTGDSATQGSSTGAQQSGTVQSNTGQSNTAQSNTGQSNSAGQTQTQTTTTTITTTTTTTTDQAQTSTTTDQTQASSTSLPVWVPAIRPGSNASDSSDSSIAQSAPHTVTTPAAVTVPASAPHAESVPLVAHPEVIWPRPQSASAPVVPHMTSLSHQQADPSAGELAHTGAAIIAPFGVAGVALGAGAALRATGHHRR